MFPAGMSLQKDSEFQKILNSVFLFSNLLFINKKFIFSTDDPATYFVSERNGT